MSRRPLPAANPLTAPYWDAARDHRLVTQQCAGCDRPILYPRPTCPYCGGMALSWREAAGTGTVFTFTVARRPTHPAFADRVPYVIAIVALSDGPHLTTNIVGCSPDEVRIGMRVQVDFDDLGEDLGSLPVFRPLDEQPHHDAMEGSP